MVATLALLVFAIVLVLLVAHSLRPKPPICDRCGGEFESLFCGYHFDDLICPSCGNEHRIYHERKR